MVLGVSSQQQPERTRAERIVAQLFDPANSRLRLEAYTTEIQLSGFQLSGEAFATMESEAPNELSDIFLDDAIEDVDICKRVAEFCTNRGLPIFCVHTGDGGTERTPVLLEPHEAEKLADLGGKAPRVALAEAAGIHLPAAAYIEAFAPTDAVRFFKKGLTDSIAVRLAVSSGSTKSTGYDFELSTKTSNLSAFWTPASGLIKGRFFGYPTSPTRGKMASGRFCFGAGTSGGGATYDMTTFFDIPALNKGYIDI